MEPRFRKRDGILNLTDTLEATKVKKFYTQTGSSGKGGHRQKEDQLSTPSQKRTEAGAIQGNKKDCGTRCGEH